MDRALEESDLFDEEDIESVGEYLESGREGKAVEELEDRAWEKLGDDYDDDEILEAVVIDRDPVLHDLKARKGVREVAKEVMDGEKGVRETEKDVREIGKDLKSLKLAGPVGNSVLFSYACISVVEGMASENFYIFSDAAEMVADVPEVAIPAAVGVGTGYYSGKMMVEYFEDRFTD